MDPVYSAETNSFFVLDTNSKELNNYNGLIFKVKDWDLIGKSDDLGRVEVTPEAIYAGSGEDMELKIIPPKGHGKNEGGYITIRIRPATDEDRTSKKTFLSNFKKSMMSAKNYGELDLSLLIEIVSCWKLPIADITSTDPLIKVKIGTRDVHETKPISKTREPIYTIKHDNLFILDVATKELTENGGMIFKAKDYDFVRRNDSLGTVVVPAETIVNGKGERMEFSLKSAKGEDAGYIALRFRPATSYDREFLDTVMESGDKKKAGEYMRTIDRYYKKTMEPHAGTGRVKAMMKKSTKEGMECVVLLLFFWCKLLVIQRVSQRWLFLR